MVDDVQPKSSLERVLSIRWLLCVNLVCLASLFAWVLFDANFPLTRDIAAWRFGFESRPQHVSPQLIAKATSWGVFGPRLVVLQLIILLAALSGLTALVRLATQSTLRHWFLVTAIGLTWLGLWRAYDAVRLAGVVLQANRALNRFVVMADTLLDDPPYGKSDVLGVSAFELHDDPFPPKIAYLDSHQDSLAFALDFGEYVQWLDAKSLRFEINADVDRYIEFHSTGTPAASATNVNGQHEMLVESIPLRVDGWYLTKYEPQTYAR